MVDWLTEEDEERFDGYLEDIDVVTLEFDAQREKFTADHAHELPKGMIDSSRPAAKYAGH